MSRPDFVNCPECEMPRSCQGVRHCAKKPGAPVTPRQAQVLTCYVKHGHYKLVARELGVEPKTVANIIGRARTALGLPNTVVLAVAWDRYQRRQA